MSGGSSRRYPPELRERAVRMVAEIRGQHDSEWAAISEVARLLVFLILDKPETLSHNDVRLLRTQTHPRKCQKSHELGAFTSARQ